ncbi:hypothetical protein MO867_21440 [Microbulbifer sp. OS29]|uniref:Glycerophosphoryl diester phosphodiesterase membrane domain-containing protein n=1 Tax=Microbulbifer okhotskensis TaxID=2926617 RepID=A0A9X2ESD3_9GAMM|nr:hypothetical protein [Microbulbifer okhotskensis]MCO1336895.1 hypothetical protein [Microbulbifer okhotskensis]
MHYTFVFIGAIVISPIVATLGHLVIGLSGNTILADYEIASFFLSPAGLFGTLTLFIVVIILELFKLSALITVLDRHEPPFLAARNAIYTTFRITTRLGGFAWKLVQKILIAMIPGLAIVIFCVIFFFTEYDINYYLQHRPIEFWLAVLLIGSGLLLTIIFSFFVIVTGGLSLPLIVLRGESVKSALFHARSLSLRVRRRFSVSICIWFLLDVLIHTVFFIAFEWFGSQVILFAKFSPDFLVVILGCLVFLLAAGNTVIDGLMSGSLALLLKSSICTTDKKLHKQCDRIHPQYFGQF